MLDYLSMNIGATHFLFAFIIAKILTYDFKPRLKESLYFILASLLSVNAQMVPMLYFDVQTTLFSGIVISFTLFMYLYKGKSYTSKKAAIFVSHALLFNLLLNYFVVNILFRFIVFPIFATQASFEYFTSLVVVHIFILLARLAATIGFTVWFITFARKSKEARYELLRKEADQENLHRYTNAVEQQYIAVRKLEHDYENILLSLQGFIDGNDFEGLKQYFLSKVAGTSSTVTKSHFALKNLDKIKATEIKSILAAKLMMAQGLDIDATFEANEDIEDVSVDSLSLVRMLGIILDNAIEAQAELENKKLYVGAFRWEHGLYFIIQNTCPPNMPAFHKLWKAGFSSKGENRGLGLANLIEIVKQLPNVSLETDIKDGDFVQKLIIELEVQSV